MVVCAAAFGGVTTSSVIKATNNTISVGPYRIYGPGSKETYAGAIAAFGAPADCHLLSGGEYVSTVIWPRLGMTMRFATLGGLTPGADACTDPAHVYLDRLTLTSHRWQTVKGLRIGDPVSKLRRLYPKALPHTGQFWIVYANSPAYGPQPLFAATVKKDRIASFFFEITGQGE
jgi:hypothetical protein